MNHTPQWSNIYNKVNVTLTNAEFGGITEKEVSLATYLDIVSLAHLDQSVNDVLSFGQVMQIANIDVASARNNQE